MPRGIRRGTSTRNKNWTIFSLERRIMLAGDVGVATESAAPITAATVLTASPVAGTTSHLAVGNTRGVVFVSPDAPNWSVSQRDSIAVTTLFCWIRRAMVWNRLQPIWRRVPISAVFISSHMVTTEESCWGISKSPQPVCRNSRVSYGAGRTRWPTMQTFCCMDVM